MALSAEQDAPPLAPQSQKSSPPSPLPSLLILGATGLKPLPTTQQVQVAAHRPTLIFLVPYRLQLQSINLPRVVHVLFGVLTVGTQMRAALFSFGTSPGEICVGPRGRCSQDQSLVLPEGCSVLDIDGQKGCVQLVENDKAQDLL